jgi:hypothetical protein
MKKGFLMEGTGLALLGAAFILAALLTDSALESLLWGFGGAALAPGLVMTVRYLYWSAPGKESRFRELQERKDIERGDELNEKLRDKSGRIAYLAGLLILVVSEVVFAVLGKMGLVKDYRIFVPYLFGLLVMQILIGMAAFHLLKRQY